MKTISYKGHQASVDYDDGMLFVKVLHIDDLLVAECNSASEAPRAVEELVEAYVEDCAELGREPTKPFKGTFNVRVGPELHRRAAISAAEEGVSLNNWVQSALEEKLAS
jgi:predicted HicB family RNase H-like nuclease